MGARMLAAKSSLAIRCDALGDEDTPSVGPEYRAVLEARLAQMEGRSLAEISSIKSVPRNTTKAYSATGAADDATLKSAKKRKLESDSDSDDEDDEPVKKKKKTKAKDKSKKSKGKDKKSKDKSKKSKSKGKSKKSKK